MERDPLAYASAYGGSREGGHNKAVLRQVLRCDLLRHRWFCLQRSHFG